MELSKRSTSEICQMIVGGLLLSTIVSGKIIYKFAPNVGTAICIGSYFGAGVVALIGLGASIAENKE